MRTFRLTTALVVLAALLTLAPVTATGASGTTRYLVVLAGTGTGGGFDLAGTKAAALSAVSLAGGTVSRDLSGQIGVLVVESSSATFADTLRASALVSEVGKDVSFQGLPTSGAAGPQTRSRGCSGTCSRSTRRRLTMSRPARARSTWASSTAASTAGTRTSSSAARARTWIARGRRLRAARRPGRGQPGALHGQPVPRHARRRHDRRSDQLIGIVGVAPNVTLVPGEGLVTRRAIATPARSSTASRTRATHGST